VHPSGEYHVPPNALDILYLRILNRPPPPDPAQTFSKEQLLTVLHGAMDGLVATVTGTSSTSTFDIDAVQKVTSGPQSLLFKTSDFRRTVLFDDSLEGFSSDPRRSGRFTNASAQPFFPFLELCTTYDAMR